MNKIEKIINANRGGTILFLGRVSNFTPEELTNFLQQQGMEYADKYIGQEVAATVLSTRMTPLEEEASYTLYDHSVPEIRLEEFESYYTQQIKPTTLMMSLKLSNDQERLKRLLHNEAFSDEVYLKLFRMYDWKGEGVYDNDDNRNITVTFAKRFFRPDGFHDLAMVYSAVTLSSIARDTREGAVLDALLTMPLHEVMQSRKESHLRPKNIREIVALNPAVSRENIRYLLSLNNQRIRTFLACNEAIGQQDQEQIVTHADQTTMMMLAQNPNLNDALFVQLLAKEPEIIQSLLIFQPITPERLRQILNAKLSADLLQYLGTNQQIDEVVDQLIGIDTRMDYTLAANRLLSTTQLSDLYQRYQEEIALPLSSNPNLDVALLEKFYVSGNYELVKNIAANPSTPQKILHELCERHDHELNKSLAPNPSVELFYLEQFALDNELIRYMTQNETYLESINSAHKGMRSDDRY
ncbi:MAG TPA: hypothetical protein ENK86_01445 [Campylobacterales bacterium]|nr:hypothetical protein [Campylobacterales bacterium]